MKPPFFRQRIVQAGIVLLLAGATTGGALIGGGSVPARAGPVSITSNCPTGSDPHWANCLSGPTIISENPQTGLGAVWEAEDSEGQPPGHNAPMAGVDGQQMYSVNPVCSSATVPFVACEAALGGPPFGKGGYPVVSLCFKMSPPPPAGVGACVQWATLTAGDINFVNYMRADGITVPMLKRALQKLGITH